MRIVWSLVAIAAVIALAGACVGHRGTTWEVQKAGLLFALPVLALVAIAIAGIRERWDRPLAIVGALTAGMIIACAGFLHAAIGVGIGLGTLISAAAQVRGTTTAVEPMLGITVLAAGVALVGCLLAAAVGRSTRFVVPDGLDLPVPPADPDGTDPPPQV